MKIERATLWVCSKCLMAIESRERTLARIPRYVDEEVTAESTCDWCEDNGFDTLYELI